MACIVKDDANVANLSRYRFFFLNVSTVELLWHLTLELHGHDWNLIKGKIFVKPKLKTLSGNILTDGNELANTHTKIKIA